ncbi:hypothetical protein C8J55DRAFT_562946 [Lentinula edodes]|uniref:Uncharacterized protein n=1 Tax=Lentinula lateritia TaxID=40482 RepID=A0A9W9DJI8_9AGAR|nr:hypothetical protein C8J55DRAFT_562946 [Lentinula edodes]
MSRNSPTDSEKTLPRSGRTIRTPTRTPQLVSVNSAASGTSSISSRRKTSPKNSGRSARETRNPSNISDDSSELLPPVPIYPKDRIYDAYNAPDWDRFESCPFGVHQELKVGDYVEFNFEEPESSEIGTFHGCIIEIRAQKWTSPSVQNFRALVSTLSNEPLPSLAARDQKLFDDVKREQTGVSRQVFGTSMAAWVDPGAVLKKMDVAIIKTNIEPPPSGLFFDHIYYVGGDTEHSFMIPAISEKNELLWPFKMIGIHDWYGRSRCQPSSCLQNWNEEIFDRFDPMLNKGDDLRNEHAGQSASTFVAPLTRSNPDDSGAANNVSQSFQEPDLIESSVSLNSSPERVASSLATKKSRGQFPETSSYCAADSQVNTLASTMEMSSSSFKGAQTLSEMNPIFQTKSPSQAQATLNISEDKSNEDLHQMTADGPSSLQSQVFGQKMGTVDASSFVMPIMEAEIDSNFDLVYPDNRSPSLPPSPDRNLVVLVKPEESIGAILPAPYASSAARINDVIEGTDSQVEVPFGGKHQTPSAPAVSKLSRSVEVTHAETQTSSLGLLRSHFHEERSSPSDGIVTNTSTTPLENYQPSLSPSSTIITPSLAVPPQCQSFQTQLEDSSRDNTMLGSAYDDQDVQWSPIAREHELVLKIKDLEALLESKSLALQQKLTEWDAKSLEVTSLEGKLQETIISQGMMKKERDIAIAERDVAIQATGQVELKLQEYREYFRLHKKLSLCD